MYVGLPLTYTLGEFMQVISVISSKGGVGKTTTAALLGSVWAAQNRSVALIDLDPQGSLSTWRKLAANETQSFYVPIFGLNTPETLRADLSRLKADLMVLDTPPGEGKMISAAMSVADLVVIPTSLSEADLERAIVTTEACRRRAVESVVLITMAASDDADAVETRRLLDDADAVPLDNTIRQLVAIRRSFGHAPRREAIAEYEPVAGELIELLDALNTPHREVLA